MKLIFIILGFLALLAVSCQNVELKREVPTSPKESYEQLPR